MAAKLARTLMTSIMGLYIMMWSPDQIASKPSRSTRRTLFSSSPIAGIPWGKLPLRLTPIICNGIDAPQVAELWAIRMPPEQTAWHSCSLEYLKLNACNLPVSYGSGIEMDKTGPWIVSHSPPLQIRGKAAHHLEVTPGEAHVDCLALNMHTMLRHA